MNRLEQELGFTAEDKAKWLEINSKYYDDPEDGWARKLLMHANPQRTAAVYVMPGYESPASGKWIETPRQRREDMKATGSREWEGMASEKKEAARQRRYADEKLDKKLDHAARTAWQHLPDGKKQTLLGA